MRRPLNAFLTLWSRAGVALILLVLVLWAWFSVKSFGSSSNLISGLGLSVFTTGIVACGMAFALAAGDFDLSVGSVAAFAGMLAATLLANGYGVAPSVAISLAAGAVVGVINGFVIAVLGVNALITTLATMQIVRGLAYLMNDGQSRGIANEAFAQIGKGTMPLYILAIVLGVMGFLLHGTTFGRNALAIGGNAEAAHLAGVPIKRTKIAIFGLLSFLAALVGVVTASQVRVGDPVIGVGMELSAVSACVLGGVALTGGLASIGHVIVGVLLMGVVQNVMDLTNVPTFYKYLVSGGVLLIAVILDRLKSRATA